MGMRLEDIIEGIEDLNEPACLDKIHQYLDKLHEKDDQFMELLVERLKYEYISWEQPWYQQSNSVTRPVKSTSKDHSQPFTLRKISKAEHKKIVKNWSKFMKEYNVPDELDSLARWKNNKCKSPHTPQETARRFVIAYLARGLERTLYQVFRHIMTTFGGTVKGAYSPAEEKIMKICFEQEPQNCVTILSAVLHREPRGIYKRFHSIYNGTPDRTVSLKLTMPVATKLVTLLLKHTGLPLEELKNQKFHTSVWEKVGEEMNHPYIYLKNLWYYKLHVQLFTNTRLKMNRVRKKAFKIIKSSPYQVWTDIRWNDLVGEFPDGVTARFLYKLCINAAVKIPGYKQRPLSEVVEEYLDKLKSKTNKNKNKRLKCLTLVDEELKEIIHQSTSE